MNRKEYLLTCLSEECAEVQKIVAKIQRFGLKDIDPSKPDLETNEIKLVQEMNDVTAVMQMVALEFKLQGWPDYIDTVSKKVKVEKFMEYSKEKGCLQ